MLRLGPEPLRAEASPEPTAPLLPLLAEGSKRDPLVLPLSTAEVGEGCGPDDKVLRYRETPLAVGLLPLLAETAGDR